MTDISVVIVNYNVKDYLYKCINSIFASHGNLSIEIIIVDNNSTDGSVAYIKGHFPNLNVISLSENIGFGRANNLGINAAKGKYILILNPDTLLQNDTLLEICNFMEANPDAGASTCKVLNGDGSFQQSCRRGFPTPISAFSKLFGLQKIFPTSKIFAKYNLSYLPTDEVYPVDAISGCFMFFRGDLLKQIGGFDEDFFMYGEDIDICYRVNKLNFKIMYVPLSSIIHYKGESTKRSNSNEIKSFYDAMEIFVKKHYSKSFIFMLFLRIGIYLRALLSYLIKFKKDISMATFDMLSLTLGMLIGSKIVFYVFIGFPDYAYPNVFMLPQLILLTVMIMVGEYFEGKNNLSKMFFGYTITFLILSTLTYFFPEYRFSRGVVLFMVGYGIISSTLARLWISLFNRFAGNSDENRILIIGSSNTFEKIIIEFGTINPGYYHFLGFINNELSNEESKFWLGTLEHLEKIIKENKINNIIISDLNLPIDTINKYVSGIGKNKVKFHYANQYQDYIASQIISDIIESSPELGNYKNTLLRYRIIKRLIDVITSSIALIIMIPMSLFSEKIRNNLNNIKNLFDGKYTLIGIKNDDGRFENLKHGLINFVNVRKNISIDNETIKKLNEYYLKNYSLSLDFDILLRKLLGK